ncbi:polyphosphate kinase 1 [Leptodesmis sichuanensis]|uniref:polyphosphate kinase 1 n=1 Tax=Leptodesmis sichuanensis TaxID=2906798 RepID=UPI001F1F4752|nr:polyphosphate kinase 1 [Leptodesmis sichuanensis]UIE36742.1 polyphosphate kinase 1 [Leptodesmis sichuanensis A121]
MAKVRETVPQIDLGDSQYYFNRELSWLEFNNRVLHEAIDTRTPLLERLKFAAIFSSNLDEFFMVRVSTLKEQVEAQVSKLTPDGRTPEQQLREISQQLRPMVTRQHQLVEQELRPLLAQHKVHILNYIDLDQDQRFYLQQYFEENVFPILTPLAIDPSHPFPHMSNLSLNLAVSVKDPVTEKDHFARVKVPSILPRFVEFPESLRQYEGQKAVWVGVPLEQVIAHNLEALFPGMVIQEYGFFRITRDADLEVQEYEADDLLIAIEQELRKRRLGGFVVRLEIQTAMPESLRSPLVEEFELTDDDVYEVEGLLNLKDLFALLGLPLPELKDPVWTPAIPPRLKRVNEYETEEAFQQQKAIEDIFSVIQEGDLLVHHPYESFTASVQRFITQAAYDPQVLAIKMTLYRTSGDSPIVNALIAAAENGKQVGVLVELKARFDEANNISWARRLEAVGVNVVYGIVGLKTHTKIVLVVRQEDKQLRRYVHIGTGNYNPKTASLYTDLGLLSCREELGADLTDLFNYLTGYSRQQAYRKLLVAPVNLRDRMLALIQRETAHAQQGHAAAITAKMNALIDPMIIRALYEASQAGVQIDLVVRGMCCLRPGIPGVSETIRVMSIIGRYLEHSRIFRFHNNGDEQIFIGSADWMPRNLDRRVEAVTPVEDPKLVNELQEILQILLSDNRQAWDLQPDGRYIQRYPGPDEAERSAQRILMERANHSE